VTKPLYKYLKPEDIRKLSSYEFAPKHIVEGWLSGRHRSRSRGLSTEFRDYRQYVSGDDPKMIDWKVFARSDRYFIRTFEQETNTACYIFLDSSASMGFGRKITKLDYASFYTAALCYLVTKSSNLVSLQIFDDKIRKFFPPGSTGKHLQSLMSALEKNYSGNRTNLSEALSKAFPLLRRRGSLIVVSDFLDDPVAIFSALGKYLHKGCKIYLFHIIAPEEINLEPEGLTRFVDMENLGRVTVHAETIKALYNKEISAHIGKIREMSMRRGVDYTVARTDSHYFELFERLVK